jgi:D-xylose transport system substrate-binding protein
MGDRSRDRSGGRAGEVLHGQLSRRRFLGTVGSAALVVSGGSWLAACGEDEEEGGGGDGAAARGKKVAFLLPSYTQKRWEAGDQAFFEQEAARHGLEVIIQVANDDETLQASQVDNVLTQGIDVLVLTPVNVDTAQAMVQKARAQQVPVVSYNYVISDADIAAVVARDAVQVGRDLAEAALAMSPSGNYVMVLGDQGTSVARDKAKGNMEILQPKIDAGEIKIVSERFNKDWSPDLAQKQVENALTANSNDVVAVVPSNDGMAYGSIEALRAQQLNGKVFVSGEDAEVDALKAIQAGDMTASSFTPFNEMGTAAAKAAAELAAGGEVTADKTIDNGAKQVPWIQIEAFNVTTENIDQFVQDHPWWVKPEELA